MEPSVLIRGLGAAKGYSTRWFGAGEGGLVVHHASEVAFTFSVHCAFVNTTFFNHFWEADSRLASKSALTAENQGTLFSHQNRLKADLI